MEGDTMSALALVLAAGMVLGDGPGRTSGEVEQGLDLRGRWEGTYIAGIGQGGLMSREGIFGLDDLTDEGGGKLSSGRGKNRRLGIYRQDDDNLIFCIREAGKGRPTSFVPSEDQTLYILNRVKPRK
jgi:hypothetical protein